MSVRKIKSDFKLPIHKELHIAAHCPLSWSVTTAGINSCKLGQFIIYSETKTRSLTSPGLMKSKPTNVSQLMILYRLWWIWMEKPFQCSDTFITDTQLWYAWNTSSGKSPGSPDAQATSTGFSLCRWVTTLFQSPPLKTKLITLLISESLDHLVQESNFGFLVPGIFFSGSWAKAQQNW